jgi:hypothetical protein
MCIGISSSFKEYPLDHRELHPPPDERHHILMTGCFRPTSSANPEITAAEIYNSHALFIDDCNLE